MHRAVWEKENGPVPDGFVIHHKDHDRRNNSIENLECIKISEHHKHHNEDLWEKLRSDPERMRQFDTKSKSWHRSEEGRSRISEVNAKNRAEGKYANNDLTRFYEGRDRWVKSPEHAEFQRKHARRLIEEGKLKPPTADALAKAAEWHSSPEGLAWHSANAKASWENRKRHVCVCQVCGKEFESAYPTLAKFCHQNCKAAALRARRKNAGV